MNMRKLLFCPLLFAPLLLSAQCPGDSTGRRELLTPTVRALLMLERPATLSVEQWEKVIENPNNWMDLQIKIYEEETIDRCDLPAADWYIILPGRRPPEKDPRLFTR